MDIKKFFKLKTTLDAALLSAAEDTAKRSGISGREAEVIVKLFYAEEGLKLTTLKETGLMAETENLINNKYVEIAESEKAVLSGRGKITGKALAQSQERLLEMALSALSREEQFILENAFEKLKY